MIVFQLLSLLLAALFVTAGFYVREKSTAENRPLRWSQFLLIGLALLLVGMVALHPVDLDFLLGPVVVGVLAALLNLVPWHPRTWSAETLRALAPYILVVVLLLGLLQWLNPPAALFLIVPAVIVGLTWRAWDSRGPWHWLAGLLLFALFATAFDLIPSALLVKLPASADILFSTLAALWSLIAAVLVGRSLLPIFSAEKRPGLVSIGLRLFFIVALVWSVVYQIQMLLAWDLMTDGLGSSLAIELIGWGAIAAAMMWVWTRADGRRAVTPALSFAVLVLVAAQVPLFQGMNVDPVQMTTARADRVNRAVLDYHAQNGRFPGALAELSPWYLWHIPEPIMIPNLTWCYQGGPDYYRLGYVYHRYFDVRASVRIHASAGTVPDVLWPCDEAAAAYNAQPYLHD